MAPLKNGKNVRPMNTMDSDKGLAITHRWAIATIFPKTATEEDILTVWFNSEATIRRRGRDILRKWASYHDGDDRLKHKDFFRLLVRSGKRIRAYAEDHDHKGAYEQSSFKKALRWNGQVPKQT